MTSTSRASPVPFDGSHRALARAITCLEAGVPVDLPSPARDVPVLGITGTGGSGKSSLTDELLNRLRRDQEDKLRVAIIAIDPTRRKGGGALLGDRIRMNSIGAPNVFFRSLATRSSHGEVPEALAGAIEACKAAEFDLVIVETPGIGQGDAGIVPYAERVALRHDAGVRCGESAREDRHARLRRRGRDQQVRPPGRADALRDVRRQVARERPEVPVFGTIAARFNDDGVTAVYHYLRSALDLPAGRLAPVDTDVSTGSTVVVPPARERYLADVADERCVGITPRRGERVARARRAPAPADRGGRARGRRRGAPSRSRSAARRVARGRSTRSRPRCARRCRARRCREWRSPAYDDDGELLRFVRRENLPGHFPFTAGVFPLKREGEDPARMFAGEGGPRARTAGSTCSRRTSPPPACRPRSTR